MICTLYVMVEIGSGGIADPTSRNHDRSSTGRNCNRSSYPDYAGIGTAIAVSTSRIAHPTRTISTILDDQTQVDSKPAGQPEHASLNQCQLIAADRRKNGALGTPSRWWR